MLSSFSRYLLYRIGLLLLVPLVFQGCSKNIEIPNSSLEGQIDLTPKEAEGLWSTVLKQTVDEQGRIDFAGLSKNPDRLVAYVSYIASVAPGNRPELFPSPNDNMAYYLNSYNALAMYGVVTLGVEEGFESLLERAKFFKYTRHSIGGNWISLLDYENKIIRPLGDPRVHFALNCMVVGCPKLPQVPFQAKLLDQQLEDATRNFFNQSQNVKIISQEEKVYLSEIIDFYTEDFPADLITYINRYRTTPIPKHYEIKYIPYDWTLNRQ